MRWELHVERTTHRARSREASPRTDSRAVTSPDQDHHLAHNVRIQQPLAWSRAHDMDEQMVWWIPALLG